MFEINNTVLEDIKRSFIIPPHPAILFELEQELNKPEPDVGEIANTVAQDIGIAASVLKVINSPAFGLARSVTDIKQAVMFIGADGILALIRGLKLKEAFDQKSCCISLERFWDTSTEIANIALYVGQRYKEQIPVENLHTLGLFVGCGIPAMAVKYNNYIKVLAAANKNYDVCLTQFEEKVYQTNHAVVGYYLANAWHLPRNICNLILRQHELDYLQGGNFYEDKLSYAILKIAENIQHTEKRYVASYDWVHVKEAVLETLCLSDDDYQELKEDVRQDLFL